MIAIGSPLFLGLVGTLLVIFTAGGWVTFGWVLIGIALAIVLLQIAVFLTAFFAAAVAA